MSARLGTFPTLDLLLASAAPIVDLVRLDAVLVAKIRDGALIEQTPLQDDGLLLRAKASSPSLHGFRLVQGVL